MIRLGTEIYYTGDMANQDGFGIVGMVIKGEAHIVMDDGREFYHSVHSIGEVYEGHCGTRFVTKEAYDRYRADRLAKL